MNSNLLKEAIADAKAVRATALANAQQALSEAFAPQFEAMFAEKLKEETSEKEVADEVSAPNDVSKAVSTKDVSKGEPEQGVDSVDGFESSAAGTAKSGPYEEAVEDEAGLTSEDLDEIIAELEQEVEDTEEVPEAPAPEAEVAPEAPSEEPVSEPVSEPESGEVTEPKGEVAPEAPAPKSSDDEEIDLNELLNDLNEIEENSDEESEEESEEDEDEDEVDLKELKKSINTKDGIENTKKLEEANEQLVAENKELKEGIQNLSKELNEINLLNAKLLYTNKLFKEFNMSNDQKMKIVEAFDLTKNVREVKLTYAVMAESLNIGGNLKKKVVSATNITEGLASKPVASTKPTKQIISEGTELASRFKKLAGIRG